GTVKPAPFPAPVTPAKLDLAAATASSGDKTKGMALFGQFCATCHTGSGYLPALQASPVILEPTGFNAVVLERGKQANGMAPFRRFFADAEAEDIRAFMLQRAAAPPKPVEMQTHGH